MNAKRVEKIVEQMKKEHERKPKRKLVLEGMLTAIIETGPTYKTHHNGIIGPGGISWREQNGNYTKIEVKSEKCAENIDYFGIILPDSINHNVQIYEEERTGIHSDVPRICIFDKELNRWYL